MVMKRGIVFTLDVIASLVVLVAAVGVVSLLQHSSDLPSVQYGNLNSIALDSVSVLEKSKIRDVENLPVVRDLLSQGILIDEDRNKTVMDAIGSLWTQGNLTMARNLTESMFTGYLPGRINYEIFMGDTLIYNLTPLSNPKTKITASTAVSGYRTGVPTSGYLSRAWVSKATGQETKIIGMSPYGSGFSCAIGGNLTMIKSFDLPETAYNFSGTLYLSMHEQGGSAYAWVNNILQNLSVTGPSRYIANTVYDSVNVSGFQSGNNTLKLLMTKPGGYHSHSHPGLVLEINYTDEKNTDYIQEQEHYELTNLSYVEGTPAAWEIFPFYIPAGSRINQVLVHVEGQSVNDNAEILINNVSVWSRSSPPLDPVVDLNVTNQVYQYVNRNATGETNTLSIYFDINKTGDDHWGGAAGIARILNTSYIILNYTLPNAIQKYGYMTFTRTVRFGGDPARVKRVNWTIGNTDLVSAFIHIAQIADWRVAAAAWHSPEAAPSWVTTPWWNPAYRYNPIYMQLFKSPTGRNIPTSIYIRTDRLAKNTTNYVEARDFDGGTENYLLPNSTVEYTVIAPGIVGYGNVFNTSSEAANDALARLAALVAPYNLTYTAATESSNIAGISWLWSPTRLKVVIGA